MFSENKSFPTHRFKDYAFFGQKSVGRVLYDIAVPSHRLITTLGSRAEAELIALEAVCNGYMIKYRVRSI